MKKLRIIVFLAVATLFCGSAHAANNVYIAQAAAGLGDGSSCVNAVAQSYFNSSGNWSATPTGIQIGPGTTVHLCGTFTEAAGASGTLTAQGSGASGNPVRIQYEAGANATAPYWGSGGFISITGKGFILIDGSPTSTPCGYVGLADVTCNGKIQATANGAALANQVPNSHGVMLGSGTHDIEVRNMACLNLFVAVQNNTSNEKTSGINNSACVWWFPSGGGGGGNINIHNNQFDYTFNGVLMAYQGSNANMHVDNNWMTHIEVGAQIGAGTSGASITSGSFNNNDASNMAVWDTSNSCDGSCPNHHEFIHLYTQQPGATISNFTIAGNYLHGTLGYSLTSEIYVECDGGSSCTAPGGLQVSEFNNRIVNEDPNADISTGAGGNTMTECEGSTCQIYDNTYFSTAHYSSLNCAMHFEAGSVITVKNNIFSGMNCAIASGGGTISAAGFNNGFGLAVACGSPCASAGNPNLSGTFQLLAGSAAIGLGQNLSALGIPGLTVDAAGLPRPALGNWDAGAFNATGTGTVALAPASFNFGPLNTGLTSSAATFTLSNTTASSVTGITSTFTGGNTGDFAIAGGTCTATLAANSSCTITVTFSPTATGARSTTLNVADSASSSPQQSALSGTGTAPVVSFSPSSVAFGNQTQGTTSSPTPVALTNTGTGALTISSISITGTNSGDFAQTNNCGSGLSAGGSCTISVTFTPSATGARSASVSVADNAAGSPQTVALTGTGVAATSGTSFSPTSISFGSQPILTSSSPSSTTLTNTGAGTLTISSIAITGTNNGDFTQTNNCGASVAPSGTCTINVTFRPTAAGTRSANVSVTDNAAGSPQTVPLTGTGTAAAVALSPASLAFGNQTTGTTSASQPVMLTNTGNATLTISSITITGTNSGDFGQANNCGSSVAVGGSCTINVTFSPTAAGARSANVSIADNASGSPQTVPLTGTGVSTAPAVSFSPGPVGFGNVVVNNHVLVVEHLKNTGNATLTISSITVGGANASMFTTHTTCGASLAAGFTCEISVTFIPTSIGAKSAAISVADNAAGSPQTFNATGFGVNGAVPTVDQYGGSVATPCASSTGRFHVEQVGSQWTYCTPLGNSFFLLGVYIVDYGGNAGYQAKITAKYGSPTAWAVPTLQRLQSWGFNSPYYTSSVILRPSATDPSYPLDANGLRSIPIKMPFTLKLAPGLYGMRNPVFNATSQFPTGQMLPIGGTVKNMAAGWSPVYYNPGNFVPPTGEADYYDPNLTTFSNNFLSSQEVTATTSPYSDYIIGVAYDDGDQVFGFGAGPDFATTPVGHNNPNLGWLTATMSPTQVASSLYPAVYTNTSVYTKAAWQTYLVGKYGTIGALNTAWGSSYTTFGSSGTNFTGEAVGTGNGSTTTFTHTLVHLTPTPFTVQVVVNGAVAGGDLGHGTTGTLFGCTAAVTPVQTMSGTVVYSTGALSVTFSTPPPNGATITVNYQQNGWQVGTGLMDEDGRVSHQSWLSGNPFTLSGANANTATDLNTFFGQMASQYLGVGHTALAAYLPGYLFLGPDTIGSWQAPPARQVLQAVPGNLDVITGSIQQPGGANYQAQLDFIFTYAGNMPQQQGEYLHANPDSPYASNPLPGDYTTQFLRGQAYGNIVVNGKTAAYTSNSAKPVIASSQFDFLDLTSEQTNWGLVTVLDNAYDGNEATTGTVTCSSPLQVYSCGGEAATYGNYISCVEQANFTNTICSGAGTPAITLSPTSISFANQIIGTVSNPQVVLVTNTGTATLTFSSFTITGANTGDFGQSNTCGTSIGVGASCTISVTFTPTAAGSRSAAVSIADNAAGSPHSVTLTGTGVAGPVVAPAPGMFSDVIHTLREVGK